MASSCVPGGLTRRLGAQRCYISGCGSESGCEVWWMGVSSRECAATSRSALAGLDSGWPSICACPTLVLVLVLVLGELTRGQTGHCDGRKGACKIGCSTTLWATLQLSLPTADASGQCCACSVQRALAGLQRGVGVGGTTCVRRRHLAMSGDRRLRATNCKGKSESERETKIAHPMVGQVVSVQGLPSASASLHHLSNAPHLTLRPTNGLETIDRYRGWPAG